MARLVSIPLSLAIEAVLADKIQNGVSDGTDNPELLPQWLAQIDALAQHLTIVDHT